MFFGEQCPSQDLSRSIEPFLEENQDIAPCLADHLCVLLEDQDRRKLLIMDLAAVIDAGEPFVKATYILEGDGLLVFSAYSTLQALSTAAAPTQLSECCCPSARTGCKCRRGSSSSVTCPCMCLAKYRLLPAEV